MPLLSSTSVPAGTIAPFAGGTAPEGWLLCNGQAYSRTTYKALFDALGGASSPWGSGDGSTTFTLPDFRGRFLRGAGTSGIYSTTLANVQADQFQGHWHELHIYREQHPNGAGSTEDQFTGPNTTLNDYVKSPVTDTVNGTPRTGAETRPANVGVNYIIKV